MGDATCSIQDCGKQRVARGWCDKHYKRWQKFGDPAFQRPPKDFAPRFWAKVDKASSATGCWLYTGGLEGKGYGAFSIGGRKRPAHRVAYELVKGPIPEGLQLDHLCRVRHCVNPTHLEPVTNRENGLRGETISATNAAKTHCINGHPFDDANTARRQDRPTTRECLTCARDRRAARTAGARHPAAPHLT